MIISVMKQELKNTGKILSTQIKRPIESFLKMFMAYSFY